MRKVLIFFSGVFISIFCLSSCQKQEDRDDSLFSDGLFVTVESPICDEGGITKSIDENFKFSFVSGDQISVYPPSTTKSYMIYELIPNSSNPKKAAVDVDYFELENVTYSAVYPAIMAKNETVVSLLGQSQVENGSTSHLSAYDYNWAETTFENNSGLFSFDHRVSWLKMTIAVSEATSFKSIEISADNGVPMSAAFNTKTGVFAPIRNVGDELVLTLGSSDGISIAAGESLVAFVTIAPGYYTNLTMTAEDSDGKKYRFVFDGEKEIVAGTYYARTLTRTDIPETTAFTRQSSLGMYGETNGEYPLSMIQYDDAHQQMSYGKGNDYRTFKLADLDQNIYAIFTISPKDMVIGEMYTVSADVNGTETQSNCKCVNVVGNCVWLEDKTTHVGYVINIE